MNLLTSLYEPGNKNLSDKEAAYRRENGVIGLVLASVLLVMLELLQAPIMYYLFLSIPIWSATLGFMQARERFCVMYGLKGIQNTRQAHGEPEQVILTKARKFDTNKAYSLLLRAAIISAIITLLIILFTY